MTLKNGPSCEDFHWEYSMWYQKRYPLPFLVPPYSHWLVVTIISIEGLLKTANLRLNQVLFSRLTRVLVRLTSPTSFLVFDPGCLLWLLLMRYNPNNSCKNYIILHAIPCNSSKAQEYLYRVTPFSRDYPRRKVDCILQSWTHLHQLRSWLARTQSSKSLSGKDQSLWFQQHKKHQAAI